MKLFFRYIFILTIFISCDSSTEFTDSKFYRELADCQKNALHLYDKFGKISLVSYRNDNMPMLEKSSQVFNLVDLLNQATKKNLTIIFYFNAHGCQNCRVMEKQILNKPEIYERLKNEFLFIPLTGDDRALLPEDKQILLSGDCNYYGSKGEIRRIAALNVNLQGYFPNAGSQPSFYAFNANSEFETIAYVKSEDTFSAFLDRLK